ncbi:MAG: hypothetical protein RL077_5602 [Verrucomicrobiota bacterium]
MSLKKNHADQLTTDSTDSTDNVRIPKQGFATEAQSAQRVEMFGVRNPESEPRPKTRLGLRGLCGSVAKHPGIGILTPSCG